MRWRTSLPIIFLVSSTQAAYVVTQSGRQIDGPKISAMEDGAVTLTTKNGQIMTFRKGQYREAVADRPEELAQAQRLLESDKPEQAIPLLKKVQTEYRFLAWDEKATRRIADYFFDTGQYAEAALEFKSLAHLEDSEIHARHREALMKSGNLELVLPALEKDIASGTREAAARAYLMRGDLKAANGDSEGARRDWLKVAAFFKAQKDQAEIAEQKLMN